MSHDGGSFHKAQHESEPGAMTRRSNPGIDSERTLVASVPSILPAGFSLDRSTANESFVAPAPTIRSMLIGRSREFVVVFLLVWIPIVTRGQAADVERPRAGAEVNFDERASEPDPSKRDVYINDSFEAADALCKARSLASRGQWREVAETLKQASETLGDKLVRTSSGYTSFRRRVTDEICGLPDEGLKVYRSLFDRELETAVSAVIQRRSVDDLLPLFERYFCTSGGARLADLIGQIAIESGDLPLADHVYRRTLDRHPDSRKFAARYNAMLAILAAIRGESPEGLLAECGDEKIMWKGQERVVRDIVAEIGSGFPSLDAKPDPNDWPMFGGEAERNRDTSTRVDEPGLLWRFRFVEPATTDKRPGIVDALVNSGRDEARRLSVFPIVAGEYVFAQRYRDIFALRRNSGSVVWKLGASDQAVDPMSYLEDRPPGWDSPAIDQGRLFAALPADDATYYNYETGRDVHELVCLDASTGRRLWRVAQKGVDPQGTATTYDSGPIARQGRVYIVSRRRRSFGFEDSYLDCYRVSDGKLLYRTHLGSASTSATGARGATKAIAALHGDTVYVCTNLGSIAAVSAYTGAVQWLQVYERFHPDATKASIWSTRELNSWHFNPVIWSDGRIVVLPTDSARLLVLSAADGRLQQAIPIEEVGDAQSVLGVHGDSLFVAGDAVVRYDLARREVEWTSPLPETMSLFGRPICTDKEILVSCREGMSRFDAVDGTRSDDSWGQDARGGNLIALPEQLFIAGADELTCYARKSGIWENLRAGMAAAPNDPAPALEFVEVAFGAGEFKEALSVLDEAVRRVGPSMSAGPPEIRDRILTDVLKFVDVLAGRAASAVDVIEKLYGYASESARDPEANISYRFRFAELFADSNQPERAVRLYQQILRDRSLREAAFGGSGPAMQRTGAVAQTRIAELVGRHGPGVYATFETEASQWLEAARHAGDEGKLHAIIETFPNSHAAPSALITIGDQLMRSKQFEKAAHEFARAYHRFGTATDQPALLRKIADAYESAGKAERAYLWLTKGIREFPSATVDDHGRPLTLAQYRDRLGDIKARVEPSLPNVALPLDQTYVHEYSGTVQLLVPAFADDPFLRWSAFYVYTPEGIRAFDAATGKERWSEPAPIRMHVELLVAHADVVVFATSFEVFALETGTGRRRWSFGEYPARLVDPNADWEDDAAFRTHALDGNRLISVRDDGTLTCITLDQGRLLWSVSRRPAALGRVCVTDSLVAYHVAQDGAAVLCMLDAETGQWLDAIITDERRSVEDLVLTLDRQIVVVTSQSITSYDVETRTRRWQVSLSWPLRRTSLLLGMDVAYLLDERGSLHKVALEDGRSLWESQQVISRGEDDPMVRRVGDCLIVTTENSVCAVDSTTGMVLWQGTTPDPARLMSRLLTRAYVVALNVSNDVQRGASTAFIYDHRNASGVIPRLGGALDLGVLDDLRTALAADGAIIIQDGSTIRGYAHE